LDTKQQDKKILDQMVAGIPEFNLLLISSWMQYWIVSVIPKYLNYAPLSKDLLSICCDAVLHSVQDRSAYIQILIQQLAQQNYYLLPWEMRELWKVCMAKGWMKCSSV